MKIKLRWIFAACLLAAVLAGNDTASAQGNLSRRGHVGIEKKDDSPGRGGRKSNPAPRPVRPRPVKDNKPTQADLNRLSAADINTRGVEVYNGGDYSAAVVWFRAAADKGDADAQYNLGSCYLYGNGVDMDYNAAVNWTRKAAEQNDRSAQRQLGYCYYNGYGVERDQEQAVYWTWLSAEQDDPGAQYNLGVFYENGWGMEQDLSQAFYWYNKSAEQDDDSAQLQVGDMYAEGRGVDKDVTLARQWYRRAAAQGNTAADERLKNL